MPTTPPLPDPLVFGPFRLDVAAARLSRAGQPVALRPKAFDLLVALARRPGSLVTKGELLDQVWGHRAITEGVVKSTVAELRTALGEQPQASGWIETVPRRGYRLAAGPAQRPDAPAGAAAATAAAQTTGVASGAAVRGNIPHPTTALLARERELSDLHDMLARHRLVTIVGPSGVGKTRMALAVAHAQRAQRPDGAWLIELAAMSGDTTGTAAIGSAIAQQLALDAAAAADVNGLARSLQAVDALLVIDNAEHVLEPVVRVVAAMLGAAPRLAVLVTSQEPLKMAGEQVLRLQPLALPAEDTETDADADRLMCSGAIRLFVERTAARLHGFTLAPEQQQAVAAICRALDGMPLALELAAARVPTLGVHGVAEMLQASDAARFRLLSDGARTAAPRQQTLRNAILWSHGLLDDVQRTVFRRLGVFAGSFSPEVAQQVCAGGPIDAWQVLDALGALTDKSLVETDARMHPLRLRLLESPRAFALEQLAASGDEAAARQRHLQAVAARMRAADGCALSEPGLPWTQALLPDLDNVRAALRWAASSHDSAALVDLACHTATLWWRAGLAPEGRHWCDLARAVPGAAQHAGLDLAVATLALYGNAYPADAAWPLAERAAVALATADPARTSYALYLEFQLRLRAQVRFERVPLLQRMRSVEQAGWNPLLQRFRRGAEGYHLRLSGDIDGYRRHCRQEMALCLRMQAQAEAWTAAQGLMLAEHDGGNPDLAVAVGAAALQEIRQAGRLRQYPTFLALWVTMLGELEACPTLRAAIAEAEPIVRSSGQPWMLHIALAWLACRSGRPADAARLLGWHDASLRAGRALAPGGYILRSMKKLDAQLIDLLGQAASDDARLRGQALDDESATALALG